MVNANRIKLELVDEVEAQWGLTCPICQHQQVTSLHHCIPRSRTSHKHEAPWLWDKRNLLLVCVQCDNPMLHTRAGIVRCLRIQAGRYKELDFTVEPWGPYMEVGDDCKKEGEIGGEVG